MEFEERRKKERKEEGKEGNELQATPHATNAESMEHLFANSNLSIKGGGRTLYTLYVPFVAAYQQSAAAKC